MSVEKKDNIIPSQAFQIVKIDEASKQSILASLSERNKLIFHNQGTSNLCNFALFSTLTEEGSFEKANAVNYLLLVSLHETMAELKSPINIGTYIGQSDNGVGIFFFDNSLPSDDTDKTKLVVRLGINNLIDKAGSILAPGILKRQIFKK